MANNTRLKPFINVTVIYVETHFTNNLRVVDNTLLIGMSDIFQIDLIDYIILLYTLYSFIERKNAKIV